MHLCRDVRVLMNFGKFIVVAALAALAGGCGGSTTTTSEIAGPTAVRCQASIAPPPSTVPHAGSQLTLTVVAERECTWTATSEAAWAQVAPASGQGQATLAVTVAANPDVSARSGVIAVNNARLSLTQEPAPCRYQLGSSRAQMSHTAGRTSVSVSAPNGCTWRASSSEGWARATPDNGSGSATVDIEATTNNGGERTATISIADQTLVVVQEGPPTCTVALDPNDRTFGAAGGDGSVRVSVPGGCTWTAAASASWIELSSSGGTGTEMLRYRVTANTSSSSRTGTITIGGRTHTVRQDAAGVGGTGGGGGGGGEEPRIDLSGPAVLVLGSCPSINFILDGRRVFTNSDTKFRGECRSIGTGTPVRVEGRVQSDGRVRATDVRVREND